MTEKRKRAEELLNQYGTIQKALNIIDEQMFSISALLRELKREENAAEGLTKSRAGDYYERLISQMTSLRVRRNLLKLRVNMIESIVNSLDVKEREIIKRFYFSQSYHRASDDLMEKLSIEKSHVYRLRSSALNNIAVLMDNFAFELALPDELRE